MRFSTVLYSSSQIISPFGFLSIKAICSNTFDIAKDRSIHSGSPAFTRLLQIHFISASGSTIASLTFATVNRG